MAFFAQNVPSTDTAIARKMEVVAEMERKVEQIAGQRAMEMLGGQITIEMIENAAAANRYRYMGVPVTEGQFNALMKASGFDTGRR